MGAAYLYSGVGTPVPGVGRKYGSRPFYFKR